MSDWTLLDHQILGQNAGTTEWPSFVRLSTGCGASLIAHDKILTVMEHATKEGSVWGAAVGIGERSTGKARVHSSSSSSS